MTNEQMEIIKDLKNEELVSLYGQYKEKGNLLLMSDEDRQITNALYNEMIKRMSK